MGQFKAREDYLKSLCEAHPVVQHGVDGRNSFFRGNNDEEIMAATVQNISYPAVGYNSFRGRLTDFDGAKVDIRHVFSNSWLFLSHISLFDGATCDAMQECWDQTFDIMEDFIKSMIADAADGCGPFKELDLNTFNYIKVGPVFEMEYGWILYFDEQQTATNLI